MSGFDPNHPPYNIKSDYGFLHVYALTMTLGIIFAVLACYIKSRKKEIPSNVLLLSVVFIIPASLLSASFFGKVTFTDFDWSNFFGYFKFWDPSGGMSIHGGVLGGVIAAVIYFIYPSRKYKISLWVFLDVIVPNILIGQVIGRWGNFFNHELLGTQVSHEWLLRWLPHWIADNCWQWADGSKSLPEMSGGDIVYRQPIFLYESTLNFCAWGFITFIIPNIGKWFGPKPWNKFEKYNPSFKYSFKKFFNPKYEEELTMSYSDVWNDAYYDVKIPIEIINEIPKNKSFSKNLQSLHNPNRYWIVKAGAEGGAYFLFWNVIRFFLETQRESDELFLHNLRTADYIVILSIAFVGFVLILISQFISPYYQRKPGWLYEKEF